MKTLIAFILFKTGYRFSKNFRYEITWFHKVIYNVVGTVQCNQLADLIEINYKNYNNNK